MAETVGGGAWAAEDTKRQEGHTEDSEGRENRGVECWGVSAGERSFSGGGTNFPVSSATEALVSSQLEVSLLVLTEMSSGGCAIC